MEAVCDPRGRSKLFIDRSLVLGQQCCDECGPNRASSGMLQAVSNCRNSPSLGPAYETQLLSSRLTVYQSLRD